MSDTADATLYRWEDLPKEPLKEGIDRRLVSGDKAMVAHVYLKKDAVVPTHTHPNEQFTYILEGALEFTLGEGAATKTVVVRAGDILHIPSDLPHMAVALEDTLDVDIFAPPRQDWLDKTDDYLRG